MTIIDPEDALCTAQRMRMSGKSVMGTMSVIYISWQVLSMSRRLTEDSPDEVSWLAFKLET
jgi:hypothetical protein